MSRFVGVNPCVFLSAHWADRVGAFGHRRPAAVANSLRMSVESLVKYIVESPPRAVGVARLLCKLADYGSYINTPRLEGPAAMPLCKYSTPKKGRSSPGA